MALVGRRPLCDVCLPPVFDLWGTALVALGDARPPSVGQDFGACFKVGTSELWGLSVVSWSFLQGFVALPWTETALEIYELVFRACVGLLVETE